MITQHIGRNWRAFAVTALVFVLLTTAPPVAAAAKDTPHQPVVRELLNLLEERDDLREAVDAAIGNAAIDGIADLVDFADYLDEIVTWIPVERDLVPKLIPLYYITNQAPGDVLNEDDAFNVWLKSFVSAYGEFLDTPASAAGIDTFARMPNYNVDDYFISPSGWLTFNQFFAREMRPGKRPIAAPRDDTVVVSPADAVFMGQHPIDEDSTIAVKSAKWAIADLLADSSYADEFRGGTYAHSFLYVDDYHRYHVPVSGIVREVRNISGRVYLDVQKNEDGTFDIIDGDTYQFNQERGLIVIDSPEVGLVAVLPIGMAYVSSVNLTPEVGAELRKGDEFGFFLFGGSDIVMVFQKDAVELDAEVGTKYLQGQRIGQKR